MRTLTVMGEIIRLVEIVRHKLEQNSEVQLYDWLCSMSILRNSRASALRASLSSISLARVAYRQENT